MTAALKPVTTLVGWAEIQDFKSPKIGERLSRSVVVRLVYRGFLQTTHTPDGQVSVKVAALEAAWLARQQGRDAAPELFCLGRGKVSDALAAAAWAILQARRSGLIAKRQAASGGQGDLFAAAV